MNYNVKFFLEQCLYSIRQASGSIEVETIVIDNRSDDGSIAFLMPLFPEVRFIPNSENEGFAKACNKGVALSKGRFILFLNPDTLIAEDTLRTCLDFFDHHPECGMVGVQMIDGSGKFLKESKRSFPGPVTALYKLFGLSRLFPRSKVFSRYHLGHLDKEHTQEVDVLAGAYIMVRKQVLDKVGVFDESFFMYGEDIDLSYRVQKAGYKNYYLSATTIIHFKGESTRMGSLNYVRLFYQAMGQFVRKHYGGTKAGVFRFFIQLAIGFRAFMAALARGIKRLGWPVLDALLIGCSFWCAAAIWSHWVRPDVQYKPSLLAVALPLFTFVYLVSAYYAGLYDKFYRRSPLVRSTITATLAVLALYALMPESVRFSRGIVLLGAFLAFIALAIEHRLLIRTGFLKVPRHHIDEAHILVAGTKEDYREIQHFMDHNDSEDKILGRISVRGDREGALADLDAVQLTALQLDARELVFCMPSISYKEMISQVKKLRGLKLRFHACGSSSLVGSDEATAAGEVMVTEKKFNLSEAPSRRLKRLVDVCFALTFLLTLPIHFLLVKNPLAFLKNCIYVLFGKKTWVGYYYNVPKLPNLRTAVTGSGGAITTMMVQLPVEQLQRIDYLYASDYNAAKDIKVILRNYKHLGS